MSRRDSPADFAVRVTAAAGLLAALALASCTTEPTGRVSAGPRTDTEIESDTVTTARDAAPDGKVRIGDVVWFTDYDAARAHARAVDLPLWVHFGEHPG